MCTSFFLGLKKKIDNNTSKEVFCVCIQCKLLLTQNYVVICILFAFSLLHFKILVLQEGHCGDDKFF